MQGICLSSSAKLAHEQKQLLSAVELANRNVGTRKRDLVVAAAVSASNTLTNNYIFVNGCGGGLLQVKEAVALEALQKYQNYFYKNRIGGLDLKKIAKYFYPIQPKFSVYKISVPLGHYFTSRKCKLQLSISLKEQLYFDNLPEGVLVKPLTFEESYLIKQFEKAVGYVERFFGDWGSLITELKNKWNLLKKGEIESMKEGIDKSNFPIWINLIPNPDCTALEESKKLDKLNGLDFAFKVAEWCLESYAKLNRVGVS